MATPNTFYELIQMHAQATPDAPAVRGLAGPDLSYAGFLAQMDWFARVLGALGIGQGDRVIVMLPNGPEMFVVLNTVRVVAVSVGMSGHAGPEEIEHFMRFTTPRAIVVQKGLGAAARQLAQKYGVRVIEIEPTPENAVGTFTVTDAPDVSGVAVQPNPPDAVNTLVHTSGTTSLPKFVSHTTRSQIAGIMSTRFYWESNGAMGPLHVLNVLPIQLAFGQMVCTLAMATGGSVACMPGMEPDHIVEWLERYRPSLLAAPPPILEQILIEVRKRPDALADWQIYGMMTTSAPLSDDLWNDLEQTFKAPLLQMYAMTETGIALTMPPTLQMQGTIFERRAGSVGRAINPENTAVMADDGTLLPPGQVGEIVVKPMQFQSYWNNPEADAQAFAGGWFHTGDEGYMDEDGFIYLSGRLKEIINSGGAKVSPYEVERVLKQHPDVAEVAVFGLPNADLGEMVAALVVGTATERELRRFAADQLPLHKVPARVFHVDSIPKTENGKVQRNRIVELLGLQ